MALVKFGGGVIQASGSIAGNTFARNRSGNYMRAKTKPVNPRSSRQSLARTSMQQLAEYWRLAAMSDAERAAWETYAAAINWQNALGETIKLTGFQHFMRSNSRILRVGGEIIEPGPTVLSLPGADTTFAVTASESTQELTVTFDNTEGWAGEVGGFLAIYMGRPQNPTRNFFGGPYRFAAAILGAVVPPTTGETMTAPFTLVEDQKIWCRASIVRADGRCSDFFSATPVVVAS